MNIRTEERTPLLWGLGMLTVTFLVIQVDHPLVRGLTALALMLVVLRSVWAVWSLGFVRPGQRLAAVRSRADLYVQGALALVCALTLLL